MAADYYSSVDAVKVLTGIQPGDLAGLDTKRQLDSWIEGKLVVVKSLIDEYVGRDFLQEEQDTGREVPPVIHNVAEMAVGRAIHVAQKYRGAAQTPETEEYQDDSLLSNRMRADLKLFRRTIHDTSAGPLPRMRVMPGKQAKHDAADFPYTREASSGW